MTARMVLALLCVGLESAVALPGNVSGSAVQPATAKCVIHGRVTRYGHGNYDLAGSQVLVRNANNRVAGTTTTSDWVIPTTHTATDPGLPYVTFKVVVPKVKMYRIKVGTHDEPVYTFKQLVAAHWKVKLTIGKP